MRIKIRINNPVLGVPISFLNKWNPDQFEIIGTSDRCGDGKVDNIRLTKKKMDSCLINGKKRYTRLFIKRK